MITIDVTAECIKKGVRINPRRCAIALAASKVKDEIAPDLEYVSVSPATGIRFFKYGHNYVVPPNKQFQDWLVDFDNGRWVPPIKITFSKGDIEYRYAPGY